VTEAPTAPEVGDKLEIVGAAAASVEIETSNASVNRPHQAHGRTFGDRDGRSTTEDHAVAVTKGCFEASMRGNNNDMHNLR
jgi:hypothetical protein